MNSFEIQRSTASVSPSPHFVHIGIPTVIYSIDFFDFIQWKPTDTSPSFILTPSKDTPWFLPGIEPE